MFGDAEAYERFMGRWSSLLAPLLVDFADVRDTGRVLDVGSGTGALAFSIAKLRIHCQVSGIDPSKEYVGYAESRNPFPDRARFQIGDAQQLRFADATFENSLSLLVFNLHSRQEEGATRGKPGNETRGLRCGSRLGLWRRDANVPDILGCSRGSRSNCREV